MAEVAQPRNVVPLGELGVEQLRGLQQQFEREIEFFSESIKQLRIAADKFGASAHAVERLAKSEANQKSLIPLSDSMYMRADLVEPQVVTVDIGTGYYVDMKHDKAVDFFKRKQKYIGDQVEKVEKLLMERKMSTVKVQEKMQEKIQAYLAQQQPQ